MRDDVSTMSRAQQDASSEQTEASERWSPLWGGQSQPSQCFTLKRANHEKNHGRLFGRLVVVVMMLVSTHNAGVGGATHCVGAFTHPGER